MGLLARKKDQSDTQDKSIGPENLTAKLTVIYNTKLKYIVKLLYRVAQKK